MTIAGPNERGPSRRAVADVDDMTDGPRQPRNACDQVRRGTSPGLLASTVQTIAAAKVIAWA
jgi:hypothetical protein